MSTAPERARLKMTLQATSGGPDSFADPLTETEQVLVERCIKEGSDRDLVEHLIRLGNWHAAHLSGTDKVFIQAGEEVEIEGRGGYLVSIPEGERPVLIRSSKGYRAWTKRKNLEPIVAVAVTP